MWSCLPQAERRWAAKQAGSCDDFNVVWYALSFAPVGKPGAITLELTRNQLRLAPQYKRGEPLVVVGTASGAPARSKEAAAPER